MAVHNLGQGNVTGYDRAKTFKPWAEESIAKIANALHLTKETVKGLTPGNATFKSDITSVVDQYADIVETHRQSLEAQLEKMKIDQRQYDQRISKKTLIKENLPKVKDQTDEIQHIKKRIKSIGIINEMLLEDVSAKLKMSISQHLTGVIRYKTAINLNKIRLSERACPTNNKNHPIEFPTKAKREEYIKNGL